MVSQNFLMVSQNFLMSLTDVKWTKEGRPLYLTSVTDVIDDKFLINRNHHIIPIWSKTLDGE
jgi:hypothetical protein